jgi:hypothetical protein
MSQLAKQFIAGAFGLIALFLVLAHSGGFEKSVKATAGGSATVFKTLQGRG